MRFNSLLIIVSTLLSTICALPLVAGPDDHSLSKRNPELSDDFAPSLSLRFDIEPDELLGRDTLELFERATKKKGPKGLPPKITFGAAARKDLDNLGLHGKERKKAKNYHKNIVKKHMKTVPGAHTAQITRIAHVGGTTPNDPLHATVAYRKKPPTLPKGQKLTASAQKKLKIPSTYTDPTTGATKTGGLHHVYPKQSQKMPSSYAAAERKRAGLAPDAPIPHKP
jgi:hypothetical protein